jgi:hypothetical protein
VTLLAARDVLVEERHLVRVRDRHRAPLLCAHGRASARPIAADHALMLDALPKTAFSVLASSHTLKRLASRYGMRRPGSFARRFIAGETGTGSDPGGTHHRTTGLTVTLDLLGESVSTVEEASRATRAYIEMIGEIEKAGVGRNISLKLTQLGLDIDRATCVDNLRRILDAATPADSSCASIWRIPRTRTRRWRRLKPSGTSAAATSAW